MPKQPVDRPLWLSFDVEATGPIPGLHSMLSIGIEAFLSIEEDFEPAGEFEVNIRPLDYTRYDPNTRAWWEREQPLAWEEAKRDPKEPEEAMRLLTTWLLDGLPNRTHVWAAYPATFDMPFLRYYAQAFASEAWEALYEGNPMERIACFDMASYAAAVLGLDYHDVEGRRMPESWTQYKNPRPHVALEDAKEQGHLLRQMLRAAHGR